MRRLVVLAAAHTVQLLRNENNNNNNNNTTNATKEQPKEYGMPVSSGSGGRGAGRSYEGDMRNGNVNVLLGGAMMGMIIVVIILLCYCCHRNMRKSRPHEYSPYWRGEPDVHSLEVFTMDSHITQCYDRNTLQSMGHLHPEETPVHTIVPGPPPAYESLIFNPVVLQVSSPSDKKPDYELGHHEHHLSSGPMSCILPVPVDLDRGQVRRHSTLGIIEDHRGVVRPEDEGLPSYEAALKLGVHGYV